MWIYKAVSDFGPINFKNVIKLSHSLFSIKNKEGKKLLSEAFFLSKGEYGKQHDNACKFYTESCTVRIQTAHHDHLVQTSVY